jgi:5-methylcytosine-specific restriction protein A
LLCGRELAEPVTKHHLIPVSKGGRNLGTVLLHRICHSKIHSAIKDSELKKRFNTIDRLKTHPEIIKFIEWIRSKPPDFYAPNKLSNTRR